MMGLNHSRKIPLWFFAPVILIALFIQKPFHIDDTLFLNIGRILPWSLIGENHGDITFLGKIYKNLTPYESTHPPLIPYFLKIIGAGSDHQFAPFWMYHLAFLVFPFLTLLEGWRLSKRKRLSPMWVWFLVLSPLFFVNATNLMTDVPMVCFWLGSISTLIGFIETGERKRAFICIAYLLAAFFTSYQSVCLIPLMLVYVFVHGKRKRKSLLIILIPVILFSSYLLIVYFVSGFFPFLASSADYNIGSEVLSGMKIPLYLHKTIGVIVFLGLGLVFPTPLLLFSLNRRRFLEYVIFASIISFTFFHLGNAYSMFEGYSLVETILVRFFMLMGGIWLFFFLAKLLDGFRILTRNPRRASNHVLLTCWFFGVLAFNVMFLPYATARYLLPAIPPAIVMLFIRPRFKMRVSLIAPLLTGLAMASLLMTLVDYRQASSDWRLFQQVKKDVGDMHRLWYSDDAGLALYLGDSGAHYIPESQNELPVGSYVLLTRGLVSETLIETMEPVATYRFPGFAGLSLFNTEAHAGFYRSLDGFLPIAFAKQVRRAILLKVNPFLKHFDHFEKIQLSSPNYADVRGFYDENDNLVRGIHMHPDAEIAFPLEPDETSLKGKRFSGQVYIPRQSWEQEGDGVLFKIGVRISGQVTWLWERWVDPATIPEDRKKLPFEVVIPPEAQAIHLKVEPGPKSDYRNDSSFWLSLDLQEAPDP